MSKKGDGLRQIDATHFDRALTAVSLDDRVSLVLEVHKALDEVSDGPVTMRGFQFRPGDLGVVVDRRVRAQATQELHQPRLGPNESTAENVRDDQSTAHSSRSEDTCQPCPA